VHVRDPLALFIRPLNRLGISYAVTGAFAAIYYGHPRITHDIDLVVALSMGDVQALYDAFAAPDFYIPDPEILARELDRHEYGHFNILHPATALRADVYLTGADGLQQWAVAHARAVTIGEDDVAIAPPEYVILRKLEYFRDGGSTKHITDIRAMREQLSDTLRRTQLRAWIEERGLQDEWTATDPVEGSP
jgi:hypothetical protein